jgi:thiol-disulfide isomerase/thioredoxin
MLAPALAHSQDVSSATTADDVMAHVESQAATQHKHILVMFGASWCGNCKLFDRFLADPAMKPLMDKSFVYADLATGESAKDPIHKNIPGGQKLQASLGGARAGWPYLVMLDEQGKLLANSVAPKTGNIGYPDAPGEIQWFMEMLKKGAPNLTPAERANIESWLKAHSSRR